MPFPIEFLLLCLVSLFAIVNPFSAVPVFLAITPGESEQERRRAARLACIVAASTMASIALVGQYVFAMLGIGLPAIQIAGGILLFAIAFEMLRSPDPPLRLNAREAAMAVEKPDIAVTPLAIPLLCGPGAVSTTIILQSEAKTLVGNVMLLVSIPIVYIVSYAVLSLSASGAEWLNPLLLRILRRLMGLLFAAIAVQFVINGIGSLPFVASGVGE